MADLWHYYGTPGDAGDGRGKITTGSLIGGVALSNFNSGGFDAVAGASDLGRFAFLAIGGLSNAWVGVLDAPANAGVGSMTDADIGFTPDFGIFANSMVNVVNTDLTDGRGSAFGLGFANGTEQTAKAMSERDGQSY